MVTIINMIQGNYFDNPKSFKELKLNFDELRKSNDLWRCAEASTLTMIENWVDSLESTSNGVKTK